MKSAEAVLLPVQRKQYEHDLRAHRDILHLDTQTRIKHMTLHFLKYAGKIAVCAESGDQGSLRAVIADTIIICLATANSLNVSLADGIPERADNLDHLCKILGAEIALDHVFEKALSELVKIAGRMAKAIESMDHLELGNPRSDLESLIKKLASAMLGVAGCLQMTLEADIQQRWDAVEAKSIFSRELAL